MPPKKSSVIHEAKAPVKEAEVTKPDLKIPEVVQDLMGILRDLLEARGFVHPHLEDIPVEFATRMMKDMSGLQVYFPKGRKGAMQERHQAIRDQYELGKTIHALAREFGVTASYVYRVIGEKA